jgi:hypothetical protein
MAIRIAALLAAPLAMSCGGVKSAGEADAGAGGDVDASSGSDGSPVDAAPRCAVAERYEVFSADDSSASAGGTAADGLFVFAGLGDGDLFKVTFATGFEPYLGADGLSDPSDGSGTQDDLVVPGAVDIVGPQLAYATAGVAVEIFGDVSGETFEQSYYATGGSVQLDSVDGQLAFSVQDVTFEHVHIDPETLEQTTDSSGCVTSIGAATVIATIEARSR